MTVTYLLGDTREQIATIPDGSVSLVACSPPFIALRSYLPADHPLKHAEIGSEPDPATFLDTLLGLTAEWGRVLAPWGSIAIELGDTYAGSIAPGENSKARLTGSERVQFTGSLKSGAAWPRPKCLALVPQLYAASLAYGRNLLTGEPSPAGQWLVRNMIVWHRPNPAVGALGDKYRPSTSYITVATRSAKRWFDLTAVRGEPIRGFAAPGATNGPEAATPSDDHGRGTYGFTERTTNPAGAPPLDAWFDEHDTWTLTTQPSSLAHYAMWPAKLAERLILSMCPASVCAVCGEPRRRVEKASYVGSKSGREYTPHVWQSGGGDTHAHSSKAPDEGARMVPVTLGWTDCGCRVLRCIPCNVLVPLEDAVRGPRQESTDQARVGETPLLGEPVEGKAGQEAIPAGVRGVFGPVHGPFGDDALLHSELRGEAGAPGGTRELNIRGRAKEPDVEGREAPSRGLLAGVGSAIDARPTEERLHDGAPLSDAGAHRPPTEVVGDRPSQKRGEGRQSRGEPGNCDSRAPRRNSDVSPLSDGVSGQLTCPHCAGVLAKSDDYRPGVVLDPFAGTGTTLAVAHLHGRDAIGIDIDARNREMYPARLDECRKTLFGAKPEMPGQLDMFGEAVA